jgi:hypothetical protein
MFPKSMKPIPSSNELSARVDAILDTRISRAGTAEAMWLITSALNGLLAGLASAEAVGVPRAILREITKPARLALLRKHREPIA